MKAKQKRERGEETEFWELEGGTMACGNDGNPDTLSSASAAVLAFIFVLRPRRGRPCVCSTKRVYRVSLSFGGIRHQKEGAALFSGNAEHEGGAIHLCLSRVLSSRRAALIAHFRVLLSAAGRSIFVRSGRGGTRKMIAAIFRLEEVN